MTIDEMIRIKELARYEGAQAVKKRAMEICANYAQGNTGAIKYTAELLEIRISEIPLPEVAD